PTRWSPHALTFKRRTNVFALKAFKAGRFEVQDEGSQLVAEACGARPGQLVVDACAGAGGKALALAAHMTNRGKIIACDRDARRVRPGGLLVYATCSISRRENEEVRASFLSEHAEFGTVAPAELLGEQRASELGATGDDVHLLPHRHGTDGFYIAGMRRG